MPATLYKYHIGDIVGDLECIDIEKDDKNVSIYVMKCTKCGRIKRMLGATIAYEHGIKHSACGKGLKTKDLVFYSHWESMRTRTTNPNYAHYMDYGGRGINSDAFANFIDFYDTMYDSYIEACIKYDKENVSLDRKDVDGNYCPENCKWVHIDEQKGNCRKTVYFVIIYPDGSSNVYRNVLKFARQRGYCPSCIADLINGRLKTYKGLRGFRIDRKSVTTNFTKDGEIIPSLVREDLGETPISVVPEV